MTLQEQIAEATDRYNKLCQAMNIERDKVEESRKRVCKIIDETGDAWRDVWNLQNELRDKKL